MAITATFKTKYGVKTWQVSPSYIMDFDGFSTGYELNAESNTAIEGSPLSNQRGMKKKTLSFSSHLVAALGVDVRKEFESWEAWIGQTGILKIGGRKFGHIWLLTSVKPSEVRIDDNGRFRSMKLTYSFEEDGNVTTQEIQASVTSTRSAVCVTATTAQKLTKKPTNKAMAAAPKKAAGGADIALGSLVTFHGGPYYATSTAVVFREKATSGATRVAAIVPSAPHPFYVIHMDAVSTVCGWVDAAQVSKRQ